MNSYGDYQLTSVAGLPHVSVAFPGEHWSDRRAAEDITPGEAVIETASGGRLYMARAASGDSGSKRLAIALRCVEIPDVNTGPLAAGPNEIVNRTIKAQEYVHAYYSGVFQLTLVTPNSAYAPGDLLGWDPAGARPTGIAGTGSWKKVNSENGAHFSVQEVRFVGTGGDAILSVRSLSGQF